MRIKILVFAYMFIGLNASLAQTIDKDVLYTVDGSPVMASEFLRVYNKNLDLVKDESQKDIDGYLDLFVNYTLKLKEAYLLEYDKKPEYIREFSSYKKQLSRNFLTDKKVTDALVKEAYDRISYDVNASHILIRLPETETDTSAVYNQILAFRDRLMNDDFETVKREVHNGNTVFAEDLGYFSGFKMVYAFENMAYNTEVGNVSKPFRTQFGYHVLKVHDKRKSRGEVTVGHIFLSKNRSDSLINPAERINEIYKMIEQGQEFESLAKQFSEDQSSSKDGGKLKAFKSGQLSSVDFEDNAFALSEPGEISKPFESDYGWHIAKLYKKEPIAPFEKMKRQLETRVKRDSRSRVINEAFIESLKNKYNISEGTDLSYFNSILNDDYIKREWTVPSDLPHDKVLIKINDQQFTYSDFASFLEIGQKRIKDNQSLESIVKTQFDAFLNENILKYHENNLENDNKEYAEILSEYRDGLLLFDLMEDKIWNAVKTDTVGLQMFYDEHKQNYIWPERIDAVVATSADKNIIERVRKALKKDIPLENIKAEFNSEDSQQLILTQGMMSADHQALPKDFIFKKGLSDIYEHNNAHHVVLVSEIIPAALKTFEEAKGKIISDYQIQVEDEWINSLKNKYLIQINTEVLNKIKSQINN